MKTFTVVFLFFFDSLEEIKKFLIEIRNNGLLMIPLVQTFGHMEVEIFLLVFFIF